MGKLTKAEDGKFTAEAEFQQKLTLVSELEGYDKVEKEVEIGAEDKTEDLKMTKSKFTLTVTVDPETAAVTDKGGLVLTKVEDGKYTAEVEFEQKLILVSELEGH